MRQRTRARIHAAKRINSRRDGKLVKTRSARSRRACTLPAILHDLFH